MPDKITATASGLPLRTPIVQRPGIFGTREYKDLVAKRERAWKALQERARMWHLMPFGYFVGPVLIRDAVDEAGTTDTDQARRLVEAWDKFETAQSDIDNYVLDSSPQGVPCPKHRARGVNPGCGDCDHA